MLFNNEYYSRGVDGNELATYSGNTLTEWYVWGSDMVGKLKGSAKYYFFKDHLGSVRAIADNNFNLVSAVDFDMWGDKMQGRIYNGDSAKFGFTGKEEDEENLYDYFGARYYDSRIGRWGGVDPLRHNEPSKTPYHYTSNNPITNIDPRGLDDYYYAGGKRVAENTRSWLHNLFVGDRYFVQSGEGDIEYDGQNYFQALSEETVKLTNWLYVEANWTSEGFIERVNDAVGDRNNDEFANREYVEEQSNEGLLDQKWNLKPGGSEEAKKYIYIYNNIALNWREAGNAVWGASVRKLGFGYGIARLGEEINHYRKYGEMDQPNEVNAVKVGYFNASFRNSKLWSKEW